MVVFSQEQDPEKKAQWEKSAHNNVNTTLVNATVEARGATAAHCGRCHSDQGFRAWLPQLMKGDPGNIKGPDGKDATVAYLTSLGLTKDKAQPITCTTCHDEKGNLRVVNDTYHLPSGFSVSAVGEGAICMTCHNTRNGRQVWNAESKPNYGGPHEASQADVLVGKNFYFVNDTSDVRNSSHAFFTGAACATCHMDMNEESHTFKASESVCTNCHGQAMVPEFVQRPTRQLMTRLRVVMASKILGIRDRIKVVRAYDEANAKYTDNFAVDGRNIQGLADISTIGGQMVFKFRMADGSEVTTPIAEIREAPGGKQVFALNDPILRASWNYLMFKFDKSWGIHNPSFAREVLQTTINALRQ
ncbi:MAG TPA: hypothetical protein VFS50_09645 [Meiothermus sp.]|nr:hypothetical protein [Meiothermus sp.]